MKRKMLSIIMVFVMGLTIPGTVFGAQGGDVGDGNLTELESEYPDWFDSDTHTVKYPITPEMEEWKQFDSWDQMKQACDIPLELAKAMTTENLMDMILSYPLLSDVYAYDTIMEGLDEIEENFPAYQVLKLRDDYAEVLLNHFSSLQIAQIVKTPSSLLSELDDIEGIEEDTEWDDFYEDIVSSDALYNAVEEDFRNQEMVDILENMVIDGVKDNIFSQEELLSIENVAETQYQKKISSDLYSDTEAGTFYKTAWDENVYDDLNLQVYQSMEGTDSADINAKRVTVKTPKGSNVTVVQFSYFGENKALGMTADYKHNWPKATILSNADNRYNCHSYAWYFVSASNRYWMSNPSKYYTDGSYKKVGASPTANAQKALWPRHKHTAHVIGYNNSPVVVKSKWGQAPLMKHEVNYSPYSGTVTYYKVAK